MDKIQFAPAIDIPLTLIVLAAFLLHFQSWARNKDVDTSVDLNALLPRARFRVILLLAAILGICWACNIAVWFLFVFLFGIGLAISLLFGGDGEGGSFLLLFAAYAIREWAFGFPQLILHPPSGTPEDDQHHEPKEDIVGKQGTTVSPLRPCGKAEFDGQALNVVSETGEFLDVGTDVTIAGKRNGLICVRAKESTEVVDVDDE
jgi:hypothetical protein